MYVTVVLLVIIFDFILDHRTIDDDTLLSPLTSHIDTDGNSHYRGPACILQGTGNSTDGVPGELAVHKVGATFRSPAFGHLMILDHGSS